MASYRRYILITGATDGIGRQTALELAANPDNLVIVHGRNEERCHDAIEYIRAQRTLSNQQQRDNLESVVADFSELRQVADMADEVVRRFPKLNVLLCNAGVLLPKRQISKDGLEMTFQVNHLAHFLLTNKLLDLLISNQPARIVIVSSICYTWHSIDWDDLNSECDYEKYVQYSRTKLMNHLFTFALNRRLRCTVNSAISCNVLEPGVIETKLLRNGGYSGSPVAEGAKASVFLSQSDDVATTTNCYFNSSAKQITASAESRDEKLQNRLWETSIEILKQKSVW